MSILNTVAMGLSYICLASTAAVVAALAARGPPAASLRPSGLFVRVVLQELSVSWFVVCDQAFQHPKFQSLVRMDLMGDRDAAGAVQLWMLAGSRLKAGHIDGVLDLFDLMQIIPDRDRVLRRAALLVQVGLWHDHDHFCPRCPRPGPGRFSFHDWRLYHKPGAVDRNAEAMRVERNSAEMKARVWERDRLPSATLGVPGRDDRTARCAYCQRVVVESTRRGDSAPEVDHVVPRAMGVDNMVVACRKCNRDKGNKPAASRGMTLHLTAAHEAALASRGDGSHPGGSAGLRAMMMGLAPVPALDWVTDPMDQAPQVGPQQSSQESGAAEPGLEAGSHPQGSAGPASRPGSPPDASAGLLAPDPALLAQGAPAASSTPPQRPQEDAGRGPDTQSPSTSTRLAGSGPWGGSSHTAHPPMDAERCPQVPGSRTSESQGREPMGACSPPESVPIGVLGDAGGSAGGPEPPAAGCGEPGRTLGGVSEKTPVAASQGWSVPISAPELAPAPQQPSIHALLAAALALAATDRPAAAQRLTGQATETTGPASSLTRLAPVQGRPSRVRAYAHGRARPPAPALAAARALARQGTAGQARGRQDGAARAEPPPRPRRRRKRGKRKASRGGSPWACPEHGDRYPCRLCAYENHDDHEEIP